MEAVLNGPLGRTILEPAVLTIGSASDNRLVVSNYNVSSHHAEIRLQGGGYSITDLGSAHGTFVNDQRLDWNDPYLLNPGDTFLIGGVRFIYEMGDASPGHVAPPQSSSAPPALPGDSLPARVQPAKRKRRALWITLAGIGIVLVAGILIFFYMLRSTPDKTLDTFCNSVQSGDYQTAYGQFSSALQRMQSEPQFASENKLTSCNHGPASQSGGTATASLTTTSISGTTLSGAVTLVQDSANNWKIDVLPSTPSITLDAFCNALKARDYQAAYNQLSARVKGQTSELDFANNLSQSQIDSCVYVTPVQSGTTATGSVTFFSTDGESVPSIVTLVKEGNTWKIDDITLS